MSTTTTTTKVNLQALAVIPALFLSYAAYRVLVRFLLLVLICFDLFGFILVGFDLLCCMLFVLIFSLSLP